MSTGCQKDRQRDRQTARQTDRKTERFFSLLMMSNSSKQKMFRMSTGCQKDRNTGRQTYRQTDRQTERQIEDRKTFQLSYKNKSC